MRETWDGLWVCEKDWEPKHPQLSIKAVPDDQRVPVARPDKSSAIGTTTTSVDASEYSNILSLTNVVSLRDGDSIGITLDNGDIQWVYVTSIKFPGGLSNNIYGDYGDIETIAQSPFSISMYFAPKDGQPSSVGILCGTRDDDNTSNIQIYQDTGVSGQLSVLYWAGGNTARFDSGTILTDGTNPQYHLIVSFSADYIRMYIDNVQQSAVGSNDGDMSSVTMGDFATSNNLYVGASNYNNNGDIYHFDGKINNFQVHTSAISSLSTYGYSSVVGLSERLLDSVTSGNTIYLSSSASVPFLSSTVTVDDL
jgi:hypothetical protein